MSQLNLDSLAAQMLNQYSLATDEKQQFKTKLRANIVWLEPNEDSEKGYTAITLPFGINLELSQEQRAKQGAKSLALMDKLAALARELPEGTSKELNPVIGGITVQIRHSGEAKQFASDAMDNAFEQLKLGFK